MAIDVGNPCSEYTLSWGAGATIVAQGNPANETGTLDYLCIWTATSNSVVDFASFSASGNDLTTNGVAQGLSSVIGQNEYNAPGQFTAFNINIGEYIGVYSVEAQIRKDNLNTSVWYVEGTDAIPCTAQAFTSQALREYSIYATGTEAGEEEGIPIPIIMNYYRQLRN